MVSAGPFLLLLMSTSIVLSSLSAPPPSSHQDVRSLQKRGTRTKRFLTAMEYTSKIAKALSPFIGLIPVAGDYINAVLSLSTTITENTKTDQMMTFLKVQFQNLNDKIDKYHIEENWAHLTNVYQKYEANIKVAWKQFQSIQKGNNWKGFKERFGNKCVSSTVQLHNSLTSSPPSFNNEFTKSLSDFSRCDEKIITGFTILIAELFFAGNAVSNFLYHQDNINKADELAKHAYESASVMFKTHTLCISDIDKYVKLDVKDLIDGNMKRDILAKNIREFLGKKFHRYDWMVVAFITENSQHDIFSSLNKHILSDAFIQEEKGDVTVAVAKQLKGTHSKAAQVKTAIEKCFKEEPECQDVIKKLGSCEETVDSCKVEGAPCKLKEAYTAVHAYIDKAHESSHAVEAKEAPKEYVGSENLPNIPYIYTGKCQKYKIFSGGHFRVLIKSDEEMMKKSPCDKLQCGKKGKCVVVEKTSVPVCKCEDGFYGENCDETLEGYKKKLEEAGKKA